MQAMPVAMFDTIQVQAYALAPSASAAVGTESTSESCDASVQVLNALTEDTVSQTLDSAESSSTALEHHDLSTELKSDSFDGAGSAAVPQSMSDVAAAASVGVQTLAMFGSEPQPQRCLATCLVIVMDAYTQATIEAAWSSECETKAVAVGTEPTSMCDASMQVAPLTQHAASDAIAQLEAPSPSPSPSQTLRVQAMPVAMFDAIQVQAYALAPSASVANGTESTSETFDASVQV
eukprot:3833834-Rhodomonas_salina.1